MQQLFLSDRFLPHRGSSRGYYYEVCRRLGIPMITSPEQGSQHFDSQQEFPIFRHVGIRSDEMGPIRASNPWGHLLVNYIPPLISMTWWTFLHTLKMKPHVIHAGGFQFAGCAALLMQKCFRIPYLLYAHGEDIQACKDTRLLGAYMRWVFRHATRVIASSEYTCNLLFEAGIAHQKIQIVPPGIHERFLNPPQGADRLRQQYDLMGKPVLLSVGRLTERKGHKLILNILPQLLKQHPKLQYVIVGTGECYKILRKQIDQLGLSEHVVFTGRVDDDELHAWYHVCDVFVLGNRALQNDIEGFGMVFLEAGAAGKPVVGGRSGGGVEAVQDGVTGYLTDPENAEDLTEKLNQLLHNASLRERMGKAGQQWARFFLWSHRVKQIESVASQLIQEVRQHQVEEASGL